MHFHRNIISSHQRSILAALCLCVGALPATETGEAVTTLLRGGLTVDKAVRIALLNNRELRAELEEVGIAESELLQATLLKNPSVEGKMQFPDAGGGHSSEITASFDLMPLFLRPAHTRLARQEVEAAKLRSAQALLNLEAEVRKAAYGYLAQRQFMERLRLIADVNEASADVAKRQFDAGNINELELRNMQGPWLRNQTEIIRAEAELQKHTEELNQLLGITTRPQKWTFTGSLPPLPDKERDWSNVEKLAVDQRPELAAARLQSANVADALQQRRSTRWLPPSLNVGVVTARESDGTQFTGPMVALEIPLFDRGQGEVAKLSAKSRQAQSSTEGLELRIRSEARLAKGTLLAARRSAEHYQKVLLPAEQKILSESLLHYNAMQISNHALLRAKEEEQRVEQESIEALRDYWVARAELDRVTAGRLPGKPMPQRKDDTNGPRVSTSPRPTMQSHKH